MPPPPPDKLEPDLKKLNDYARQRGGELPYDELNKDLP